MSLWKYLSQHNPWYKMTGLQVTAFRYTLVGMQITSCPDRHDAFVRLMDMPEILY